jgi:hypothetical protein
MAGNKGTAVRTVTVIDTVSPVISFETNGNATYAKSRSTVVNVTDSSTISTLKYLWNTSTTALTESSFTSSPTFTNGGTISTPVGVTGSYYLWILAKDSLSNTTISRSNVFNLDNIAPTITMNGTSPITIYAGSSYTDAGATASDNIDGDITSKVTINSTLNSSIPGTYTITYSVSDTAGNTSSAGSRTIEVINSKVNDLSSHNYDAILANGARFANGGLDFDGVDDYAYIPTLPATDNWKGGITIEFTAKWDNFNSWSRIFDFGNGAGVDNILVANNGTSQILMLSSHDSSAGTGSIDFALGTILTSKATYKIVATKGTSNYTADLYINGTFTSTGTLTDYNVFENVNRSYNYFGRSLWGDPYFDGTIYDLKITQADGTVIMNYDFTNPSNYIY